MFEEDLSALFDDSDVIATSGGRSAKVWFNTPDQGVLGEMQISSMYEMDCKASDFPGLKHKDTVEIGGVIYTVREVFLIEDGARKRVEMKR